MWIPLPHTIIRTTSMNFSAHMNVSFRNRELRRRGTNGQKVNPLFRVIHKPRGRLRGEGVCQMTILLHQTYLVKSDHEGGGDVKNIQKLGHVVYG